MVKADIGDHRQDGGDDVGTIEPAAQANLYDSHIDLLLLEIEKRHR